MFHAVHAALCSHPLLTVGIMTLAGLYMGRAAQKIKLPSIIGFMVLGVLLGPSAAGILDAQLFEDLSFISDIALGFVALSIGLELNIGSLRQLGRGIAVIIFAEAAAAFIVVFGCVFALTRDLPMSLIFGAIAPASAPAGTVAVIREYGASGPLTKALYAVVGFDDGLGIIIFGFASSVAKSLLAGGRSDLGSLVSGPMTEIALSIGAGILIAILFGALASRAKNPSELIILLFSAVLAGSGLSNALSLSLILTNMTMGMVISNSGIHGLVNRISSELVRIMPLLFVMFFIMAGANLHVDALPSLGVLGMVYVLSRTAGLMGGAFLGAAAGKTAPVIRKYLGMGILSQAGVAIGLALIVKQQFSPLGEAGERIGGAVITTVTATCIFFEIIGPLLTKRALEKAGETGAVKSVD